MSRLQSRLRKLEQTRGRGTYCLLYTDSWTPEQLTAEIERLNKQYATVLPLLVDEDDLWA